MGIEAEEENEMKHKHYEMIVAKAANMGLVCFVKRPDVEWVECDDRILPCIDEHEYFLCLPQHKEACLHWLNGGEVQYRIALDVWTDASNNVSNAAWSSDNLLMDDQVEFRIKPKKEKRWIATFPWAGNAFYVTPESFSSEELLNGYVDMHYGKRDLMIVHQIEVEV